jgi:flagellar biogenesis protein FliO
MSATRQIAALLAVCAACAAGAGEGRAEVPFHSTSPVGGAVEGLQVDRVFSSGNSEWPRSVSNSVIELASFESGASTAQRQAPLSNGGAEPHRLRRAGPVPLLSVPSPKASDPLEAIRRMGSGEDAGRTETSSPVPLDLLQLATWTAVVLGAGIAGILLLKRLGMGGRMASGPAAEIKLRGTLMLAPRTGVHLVSVASQEFLVAIDPRGVSSVTIVPPRFEEDEEAEESARFDGTLLEKPGRPGHV